MKKTLRLMAFALMSAAMFGIAACSDEDDYNNTSTPQNTTPYYRLSFNGQDLSDGDTVIYDASADVFQTAINLYVTNLTDGDLVTTQYTEQVDGAYDYAVCYGGQCPPQQDNEFTLPAGYDEVMSLITIEAHLGTSEGPACFKLTVGEGSNKAHATTAYIQMLR